MHVTRPTRDGMIRVVAALVSSDGVMPTIHRVRQALGNVSSADRWVTEEFGRYDLLFKLVRTYLQTNPKPRLLPTVEVVLPPPRAVTMVAPAKPVYRTLAEGLDTIRRIGVQIEDPVDILFLSRFWQIRAAPKQLPTWAEWQATVQRESYKLVAYLEGLKLLAGQEDIETRKFARITFRRTHKQDGSQLVNDISIQQSDDLKSLIPQIARDHEGHIWLRRRVNPMHYDVVACEGEGVNEFTWSPAPPPTPIAHKKGQRVQAPDAESLEETRKRLQKLLAGGSFDQVLVSRAQPLFTPAELKDVKPLVKLPIPLRTDARGFLPSSIDWKDIALRPSEKRFVGHLPEPSRFELVLIWAMSFAFGLRFMRSAPMKSLNSGAIFMNYPEGT